MAPSLAFVFRIFFYDIALLETPDDQLLQDLCARLLGFDYPEEPGVGQM